MSWFSTIRKRFADFEADLEKQYAENSGTNGMALAAVASTSNDYTELKKKTVDAAVQTPRHVAIQVRNRGRCWLSYCRVHFNIKKRPKGPKVGKQNGVPGANSFFFCVRTDRFSPHMNRNRIVA